MRRSAATRPPGIEAGGTAAEKRARLAEYEAFDQGAAVADAQAQIDAQQQASEVDPSSATDDEHTETDA
jgi:hypothetical protein